jgi:hypothetical protein
VTPHLARRGTRTPISIGACLAFLIVFFFSSLRCRALFCLLWSPFYCLFSCVPRTKRSGGRGEAQTERGFHVLTLAPARAIRSCATSVSVSALFAFCECTIYPSCLARKWVIDIPSFPGERSAAMSCPARRERAVLLMSEFGYRGSHYRERGARGIVLRRGVAHGHCVRCLALLTPGVGGGGRGEGGRERRRTSRTEAALAHAPCFVHSLVIIRRLLHYL